MTNQEVKRKLTAMLSADVKGYSRLMGADEEGTTRTLNTYREVMSGLVQRHHGRVVDATGDNILAEFASVVDAVRCAVEIQKELKIRNEELPENRSMEFRIGINLGDVIEEEGRLFGDGVNVAARLESLSDAGGICISGTAYDQVENKLSLGYEYLGEQTVKNIAKPVRVYRVLMEPEAAGKVIGEKRAKSKQWQRVTIGLVVAVIAVVAAVVIWKFYSSTAPKTEVASKEKMVFPLPDKPSIAVLPFTNMSGDPKQEYFSDGLTEQIITTLSKVDRLFVIARNSTFVYKGRPVKIQKVAEDLGVQYVMEGSIQRSADRVRITAQLIDALTGRHIWAERYERDLKDIFALQDEITMEILNAIRVKLTEGEQALAWMKWGTDNLKAYEKVLQGKDLMLRNTKQDNDLARQLFEEAIAHDPKYVWPYVNLGWTHYLDVRFGWSESRAKSLQKASELAQKALAMDDSMSSAHSLLSAISLVKFQFEKAMAEAERAVALNPNGAQCIFVLAGILGHAGRWEESVSYAKKSIRLDPVPDIFKMFVLGRAQFMIGQYDESIVTWKKALQRNSDYLPAHVFLAACYSSLGRDAEASAEAKEVLRIDPKFSIESHAKILPYKNKADIEREVNALRKAGLAEKSSANIPPSTEVAPKEKIPAPKSEKVSKPLTHPPPKEEVASKEKMAFPLPDKPSIAVLPFTNIGGGKELEYFSDGLAEGIINGLAKSDRIFVIARNSTFTYKGKSVKAKQVAQEMGVQYVIEGSIQQERNRVRVTVQLIDALSGRHLFSERYDRDLKNILNLQDEITLKVLIAVQVKLTKGEMARISEKGTKNLDAYLKVLQAAEYKGGTLNKERVERAIQLLEEAIALDPEYAIAYSTLCTAHFDLVIIGASQSPKESLQRAVELGKRAIALDESNSTVHACLTFPYMYLREFDKAIAEAEKAISLGPNSALAYWALGTALSLSGRPQEAIPMLQKSLRLSPIPVHSQVLGILAGAYSNLGQYEEATATYKKVLQIYGPDHLLAHIGLAITYAYMDRENEARAEGAEVLRIDPKFSGERWIKGLPYSQSVKDRIADALRKAGLK